MTHFCATHFFCTSKTLKSTLSVSAKIGTFSSPRVCSTNNNDILWVLGVLKKAQKVTLSRVKVLGDELKFHLNSLSVDYDNFKTTIIELLNILRDGVQTLEFNSTVTSTLVDINYYYLILLLNFNNNMNFTNVNMCYKCKYSVISMVYLKLLVFQTFLSNIKKVLW